MTQGSGIGVRPDPAGDRRQLRRLEAMPDTDLEAHLQGVRVAARARQELDPGLIRAVGVVVPGRRHHFVDATLADDLLALADRQELPWGYAAAAALGETIEAQHEDEDELLAIDVAPSQDQAAATRSVAAGIEDSPSAVRATPSPTVSRAAARIRVRAQTVQAKPSTPGPLRPAPTRRHLT